MIGCRGPAGEEIQGLLGFRADFGGEREHDEVGVGGERHPFVGEIEVSEFVARRRFGEPEAVQVGLAAPRTGASFVSTRVFGCESRSVSQPAKRGFEMSTTRLENLSGRAGRWSAERALRFWRFVVDRPLV